MTKEEFREKIVKIGSMHVRYDIKHVSYYNVGLDLEEVRQFDSVLADKLAAANKSALETLEYIAARYMDASKAAK